jgi:hypothetical protein
MTRRANKTPRDPLAAGFWLEFLPHEFRRLKHNPIPTSGKKPGGMARLENHLVAETEPATLRVWLDDTRNSRCQRYCMTYGPGGPNQRIRDACIPAYRRAGIELVPDWCAPKAPP